MPFIITLSGNVLTNESSFDLFSPSTGIARNSLVIINPMTLSGVYKTTRFVSLGRRNLTKERIWQSIVFKYVRCILENTNWGRKLGSRCLLRIHILCCG